MAVFTVWAIVNVLGADFNIVDRHVKRAAFEDLAEAQPVFLVGTQILLHQDTAYVVVIGTERLRCAAIAIHSLHDATVTHGLVDGLVLLFIISISSQPTLASKLRKLIGIPQGSLFR